MLAATAELAGAIAEDSRRGSEEAEMRQLEGRQLYQLQQQLQQLGQQPDSSAESDKDFREHLKPAELFLQSLQGAGTHFEVYRAIWWRSFASSTSAITVAVKQLRQGSGVQVSREQLGDSISHPNLVRYFATTNLVPDVIVSEFCSGGSLYKCIHSAQTILSWTQRLHILVNVAKGMEYLHGCKPSILHKDLKSSNIMLAKSLSRPGQIPLAKVGDFGLTWNLSAEDRLLRGVGVWRWTAPEAFSGQEGFAMPADVFSFAMVMYECLTQQVPYSETWPVGAAVNPMQIASEMLRGTRPTVQNAGSCPREALALMQECWASDPLLRPSFALVHQRLQQQLDVLPQDSILCKQ